MTQQISTPADLLSKGPDACLKFLHDHFPGKFDWLRLAEGAATKASSYIVLSQQPLDMGLAWIRVAVTLYETMADHPRSDGKAAKLRLVMPALGLRALAIRTWGLRSDVPVLSADEIAGRFLSNVEVSAKDLAADSTFPRPSAIRNALEMTRYLEPLWDSSTLKSQLPKLYEYCEAARTARSNAQTKTVGEE